MGFSILLVDNFIYLVAITNFFFVKQSFIFLFWVIHDKCILLISTSICIHLLNTTSDTPFKTHPLCEIGVCEVVCKIWTTSFFYIFLIYFKCTIFTHRKRSNLSMFDRIYKQQLLFFFCFESCVRVFDKTYASIYGPKISWKKGNYWKLNFEDFLLQLSCKQL